MTGSQICEPPQVLIVVWNEPELRRQVFAHAAVRLMYPTADCLLTVSGPTAKFVVFIYCDTLSFTILTLLVGSSIRFFASYPSYFLTVPVEKSQQKRRQLRRSVHSINHLHPTDVSSASPTTARVRTAGIR